MFPTRCVAAALATVLSAPAQQQPAGVDLGEQQHSSMPAATLRVHARPCDGLPNDDVVFHNVFSLSRAATFDLGRYPKDRTRSATFTRPGLVKVYCRIHSQMSATIVVLDHPYFAVPGDDGTFTLRNVPPGQYTLVGWHERVGERSVTVRVEPGGTTDVELTLPVEDGK